MGERESREECFFACFIASPLSRVFTKIYNKQKKLSFLIFFKALITDYRPSVLSDK
jgi:hypothetical protein